jgi:hypothetical protein
MTKLAIRRDALEKIVDAFEKLLVEVPREPTDRERTMLRWCREFLSDDVSPVDRVLKQLGTLKPGWERPLSQVEMHEMHGSLDTLSTFTDAEWQTIREYLSYAPKSWEKLYQVKSRQWFLQAPVDTLTASETWRDANKAIEPRRKAVNQPVGDTMTKEEMLAILRGQD